MTRKNARELACGMVYAFGHGFGPEELIEERFSPQYLDRVREEDEIFAQMPDDEARLYIERVLSGVYEHMAEIDGYIEKYSIGWKFDRLPRMALAVMRVCMFEVLYMDDIPDRAAIHEAVEISKHYEPAEITSFINGVLGSFVRAEKTGDE